MSDKDFIEKHMPDPGQMIVCDGCGEKWRQSLLKELHNRSNAYLLCAKCYEFWYDIAMRQDLPPKLG